MAESTDSLDSDSSEKLDYVKNESQIEKSLILEDDSYPSVSLEGSVVASPSIESFSTLPEGESSLSLGDTGNDLVARVDGPQKQSDLLETYITFRVSTKTSREGYEAPAYSVRRRYNDFVWLRQHLIHAFPTHFVPPLPAKHSIIGQFDRYGREFVTARMSALQVFLNRVVKHPILSFAPCFKCFLTANAEEFQELRRLTTSSLLTKVSDSLKTLSTLHIEAHRPPEMNKLYDYVGNLSEKLNHLCRINQRIRRERTEQVRDFQDLKPALRGWAGTESDLTDEICCVANAVEKCENGLQNILLDTENIIISQPLKEYVLYVEAVRETLDRRDELGVELIHRKEQLEKKRSDLELLRDEAVEGGGIRSWVKPFETKEERLEKLNSGIAVTQTSVEEAKDRLDCANENIRADMDRWLDDKQADLKSILLSFADQHISYYEQCQTAWSDVVDDLRKSQGAESSQN